MDVADLRTAASAIAGGDGSRGEAEAEAAVTVAFAGQLASQGFVRLRLPPRRGNDATDGDEVTTAAASVFKRSRPEKLQLSDRRFFPESGHCVCVGYCAQDCAREYWELRRAPRHNLSSVVATMRDSDGATAQGWWPEQSADGADGKVGAVGKRLGVVAAGAAGELEGVANAALLLALQALLGGGGDGSAGSAMDRLLLSGTRAYDGTQQDDATDDGVVAEDEGADASVWRVHRYDPEGCGGGEQRMAQAAHLDLGLITVTPRGTAAGLELLQSDGTWVLAEAAMGNDELLVFGGQVRNAIID